MSRANFKYDYFNTHRYPYPKSKKMISNMKPYATTDLQNFVQKSVEFIG
jgi:hypothetical protein